MAVASELVELGSGEEPTMGCVELMREAVMSLTFTGNSLSEVRGRLSILVSGGLASGAGRLSEHWMARRGRELAVAFYRPGMGMWSATLVEMCISMTIT